MTTKVKADEIAETAGTEAERTAAKAVSDRAQLQMGMVSSLLSDTNRASEGFQIQIYNGLPVTSPYPFQVAIELNRKGLTNYDNFHCGGTLVSASWVLTAFHCAPPQSAPDVVFVWAGSKSLDSGNGQKLNVDRVEVPGPYNQNTGENDVALLHLDSPAVNLSTVNLVNGSNEASLIASNPLGIILGWGAVNTQVAKSDQLRYNYVAVSVSAAALATCNVDYSGMITAKSFCTGGTQVGVCTGDSGGPLILTAADGSYFQEGVTSQISGPCGGLPGVFARIPAYIPWIQDKIRLPAGQ